MDSVSAGYYFHPDKGLASHDVKEHLGLVTTIATVCGHLELQKLDRNHPNLTHKIPLLLSAAG